MGKKFFLREVLFGKINGRKLNIGLFIKVREFNGVAYMDCEKEWKVILWAFLSRMVSSPS